MAFHTLESFEVGETLQIWTNGLTKQLSQIYLAGNQAGPAIYVWLEASPTVVTCLDVGSPSTAG